MPPPRDLKVVIVGAGFGGLAAAIELLEHGFRDLVILDRAAELGGTWFHNDYPGSACDVPSHLYSFSFAQRRDWSRLCSPQDEILRYLHDVAREHGVDRMITLDTDVSSCTWDDELRRWTVASTDGRTWDADAVVIATEWPEFGALDLQTLRSVAHGDLLFDGRSLISPAAACAAGFRYAGPSGVLAANTSARLVGTAA